MMRLGMLTVAGAALLACGVATRAQDSAVAVPRGEAPTIDGRLAAGEWDAAARRPIPGGGEVLLMRSGDFLYLGMRATRTGFPSVCVESGDTTRVLHASAALGTAVYVREASGAHRLGAPFAWGMRNPALTPEAAAERAAFLREHGWLASTIRMGGTEKEMQIPLRFIGGDARLGLAYFSEAPGGPPVTVWPAGMADGCAAEQMVRGFDVDELRFDPRQWARLEIR